MRWVGKKINYVRIGIESPQFLPREEASTSLSISTTTPRIVTIAELTANKGISYGLEAIADLHKRNFEVTYMVIGEGEERDTLETYAEKIGISDRVTFPGFIPDASKYLLAFDLFLLPSVKEGAPYVLLEAAKAGLPIVCTDVVLGVLPNEEVVPAADARAIADAIILNLQRPLGDSTLPSEYELSAMLEKTITLYH